ncbi:aldo/keto reductase [Vibrio kasasachensis]|uniref:aldo/keto reductase n=1 Tax=Vibrio kasasachensis TaxID=2910248 RepID=UPI003D0FA598
MNVGLGTVSFGTSIPEHQAQEIMNIFVESGGTIIDTANNYAFWAGKGGESETVIGNWLKTINREQIEIHTKIGALPLDGMNFSTAEGLSKESIQSAVNASLGRLSTHYIDVLYAHIDDTSTPLLETWSALSSLVHGGVVKRLGISNYSLSRIVELQNIIDKYDLIPISYAQYRYTIIEPQTDADLGVQICFSPQIITALTKHNPKIKLVAYSPLLRGAFEYGHTLPDKYAGDLNEMIVNKNREEAEYHQVTPSALVLKKISDQGIIPLTISSKVERLKENIQLFL